MTEKNLAVPKAFIQVNRSLTRKDYGQINGRTRLERFKKLHWIHCFLFANYKLAFSLLTIVGTKILLHFLFISCDGQNIVFKWKTVKGQHICIQYRPHTSLPIIGLCSIFESLSKLNVVNIKTLNIVYFK